MMNLLLKNGGGKEIKGFLVDDVDRLLQFIATPNLIKIITLTIPNTDNLN